MLWKLLLFDKITVVSTVAILSRVAWRDTGEFVVSTAYIVVVNVIALHDLVLRVINLGG